MPIDLNGQAVGDVTLNGNAIGEVTVNGQTVFSGQNLPVAYSNLVAWYPFDSSFYGGSNADDATALFNPAQSGDSTAYDGTVDGATYQTSGGVTDINAGANSGAFDFDGSNDSIDIGSPLSSLSGGFSISFWMKPDSVSSLDELALNTHADSRQLEIFYDEENYSNTGITIYIEGSSGNSWKYYDLDMPPDGTYYHCAFTVPDSNVNNWTVYVNNDDTNDIGNNGLSSLTSLSGTWLIGTRPELGRFFDGTIEDYRIYNRALTQSEVSDIFNATKP